MRHPLLVVIGALGQQAYLRLWIAALARWLTVVLVTLYVLALIDWSWRSEVPLERWTLSLVGAMAVLAAAYRLVIPLLSYRPDPVSVARWVERIDSRWGDQLSSAIAFLLARDAELQYTSSQLRQVLIEQVGGSIASLQPSRYLVWRTVRRSLTSLVIVVLVGLASWGIAADQVAVAVRRLVMPWRNESWPRRHVLELVDLPEKIAFGQDLEIVVVDQRGQLPESVTLYYRWKDQSSVESRPMTFAGGRMVYRLTNVTRALDVRVAGGDDQQMPWQTVEVVQPPEVVQNRIYVDPPSSSGYDAYQMSGSGDALVGSKLTWEAIFSPEPDHVRLLVEPNELCQWPDGAGPVDQTHRPADGLSWRVESVSAIASGQLRYCWELRFADGLLWQSPWLRVSILEDRPPSVVFDPVPKLTAVTRRAHLPLGGRAEDDLAVRRVTVEFSVGAAQRILEVYSAENPVRHSGMPPPQRPDQRRWQVVVDLSQLGSELSSNSVSIVAKVEDFAGQLQATEPLVLALVDDAQYERRLAQLQAELVPLLRELLQMQHSAQDQVRQVYEAYQRDTAPAEALVDRWNSAELHQRRVGRLLLSDPDSLRSRVEQLQRVWEINQLHLPDLENSLQDLQAALNSVQELLPSIEAAAALVARQLPESIASQKKSESLLAAMERTIDGQTKVLEELQGLLARLSGWEGYRQFADKLGELQQAQQRLVEQTTRWQAHQLGSNSSQLSGPQQAELSRLAEQQDDLRRRFEQLQGGMQEALPQLQQTQPQAAQRVQQALDTANQFDVVASMRAAARDVQQNRLGRAAGAQRRVVQGLQQMTEALADQRGDSGVEGLAQALRELEQLQTQQSHLDQQRKDASQSPDGAAAEQLAREQSAVSQRTSETSKRVAPLHPGSARLLEDAAGHMQELASETLEKRWEQAHQTAQQVQRSLHDAAQLLRTSQNVTRQQTLAQELAEVQRLLAKWDSHQRRLADETSQLQEKFEQQTVWSVEQREKLDRLAEEHYGLASQVRQAADSFSALAVVPFELRRIADLMESVAMRLGRHEAGRHTQAEQRRVLDRLQQLIQLMDLNRAPMLPSPNIPVGKPTEPQEGNVPAISMQELLLLEKLQADLKQRTAELDAERSRFTGVPPADWQEAVRRLGDEQAALVRLLERLRGHLSQGNN